MGRAIRFGAAAVATAIVVVAFCAAPPAGLSRAEAMPAPDRATISKVRTGAGTATVLTRRCKYARGCQFQVARNRSFTKSLKSKKKTTVISKCDFSGLGQNATWYARARGFTGKRYGKWSAAFRFRTTKAAKRRVLRTVPARYHYKIRFMYQPDDSVISVDYNSGVPVYIETDNPDPDGFRIGDSRIAGGGLGFGSIRFCDDDSGVCDDLSSYESIPVKILPSDCYDPDNVSTHFHAYRVPGGYAGYMWFTKPGIYPLSIVEETDNTTATCQAGSIDVLDGKKLRFDAIDKLIDEVCDKSLPKGDQMQQVADYIRDHSYYGPQGLGCHLFCYPGNLGFVSYAKGEMSWLNSSGSGALLVAVGRQMGYPLKNLWDSDENGRPYPSMDEIDPSNSPEWAAKHYLAYSKADDRYFNCCPPEYTGKAYISTLRDSTGKIRQFDFVHYEGYVDAR